MSSGKTATATGAGAASTDDAAANASYPSHATSGEGTAGAAVDGMGRTKLQTKRYQKSLPQASQLMSMTRCQGEEKGAQEHSTHESGTGRT